MEKPFHETIDNTNRVTSTYAEIYLDDEFCGYKRAVSDDVSILDNTRKLKSTVKEEKANETKGEWTSPSDLLLGKVALSPPFTSKITRGQTHEGILDIGGETLKKERDKYLKYLANMIEQNDAAWSYIEEQEKLEVVTKVKAIYSNIFKTKTRLMVKEMDEFFKSSLQELEDNARCEIKSALVNARCHVINELNIDIHKKMKKEKDILRKVLEKRYRGEILKIKQYYKLLLDNEKYRNNKLINNAITERNDALKAFYNRIEAENFTTAMYVMSTERKKCRIKHFFLESVQQREIAEKAKRVKEKHEFLNEYKSCIVPIDDLNKQWEEKVGKLLKLFLKFITFSLKLLPEQSTFLLDLEKMLVLQLNEIQKDHSSKNSVLIYEKELWNMLKFEKQSPAETVCDKKPFEIEGDLLAEDEATLYGSRETLPSHKDLPFIRVDRHYIYAKCQKMEEVKAFLEAQRCKCDEVPHKGYPPEPESEPRAHVGSPTPPQSPKSHLSSSTVELLELFKVDDIERILNCPVRACQDWGKRHSFPYLDSYLDYSDSNYERVKTIIGKSKPLDPAPEIIKAYDIVYQELRFGKTKEKTHDVGTQYSRQDLIGEMLPIPSCPCIKSAVSLSELLQELPDTTKAPNVEDLVMKRQNSLRRLMQSNPNLLKIFTNESFDFIL